MISIKRKHPGTRRTLDERIYEHVIKKLMLEMAVTRQSFKDKVGEKLRPAIEHTYYTYLAEELGEQEYVQHWKSEVKYMLHDFGERIEMLSVKDRFNRRKAVDEVINTIKGSDKTRRERAANHVMRCYGLNRLNVTISDECTEKFWNTVETEKECALLAYETNGDAKV